jgi:hypothetical protein
MIINLITLYEHAENITLFFNNKRDKIGFQLVEYLLVLSV